MKICKNVIVILIIYLYISHENKSIKFELLSFSAKINTSKGKSN